MPGNYKGTFWGLEEKKFEVRIIGNSGSSQYTEIELSDNSPFIVNYNTSNTPFEPVRTSTATINVVHNDYMEDILSAKAHGTKIELAEISGNTSVVRWTGWLTPKIYDAGYEDCYETFQLEAADCISSLQYFDYEPIENMGVVSFKQIIKQICDKCENLEGYYWTRSKKIGTTVVKPEHLFISERNFFSSDIEEPWKLSEVLEEVCRYLGFTCLQWGKRMYFIDYQYLTSNGDIYASYCPKSNGYSFGSATHLEASKTITAEDYRLNGASISFEPVCNKIRVVANLYSIEDFLPNIFDDAFLVNRNDPTSGEGFYNSVEVVPKTTPGSFPSGSSFLGFGQDYDYEYKEGSKDSKGKKDQDFVYRYRIYDHKYWESVYTDMAGNEHFVLSTGITASSSITLDYRGGTIVDMGVVKKPYRNGQQQLVVPSKMDYTRYLCINEMHSGYTAGQSNVGKSYGDDKVVFRLKDGYKPNILPVADCFLVINYSMLLEKYRDRNYINPEWTDKHCSAYFFKAGSHHNSIGNVKFRLKIGDKYWNGSTWTATNSTFQIEAEWDKEGGMFKTEDEDYWNTELSVLNNISWEDELNAQGYKIPLDGIDISDTIEFEIINPSPSFWGNTGSNRFENYGFEYNAFCWIKDLSFDFIRKFHESKEENDITYENVVDGESVHEFGDIACKITTDNSDAQPSYSSVAYKLSNNDTMHVLSAITEDSIEGTPERPEDNIVLKYVYQYNTPTAKISLSLSDEIPPFQKLFAVDVEDTSQGFVQLGTEIDYHMSRQRMTCVEKKKNIPSNE